MRVRLRPAAKKVVSGTANSRADLWRLGACGPACAGRAGKAEPGADAGASGGAQRRRLDLYTAQFGNAAWMLDVLRRVMRDSRPPADLRHIERPTRHDGPLRRSARLKPPGKSVPRPGVQSLSSPSNPMSQWRP
jgi:hypothetical protein